MKQTAPTDTPCNCAREDRPDYFCPVHEAHLLPATDADGLTPREVAAAHALYARWGDEETGGVKIHDDPRTVAQVALRASEVVREAPTEPNRTTLCCFFNHDGYDNACSCACHLETPHG